MIPDCLDGIKSFSQNENQKLSDWLIASVLRHSKFSTCVNFNKISIIINSWWGASFQYYCYSKYSTWDKISEHQTNVHYYIWGRLLISKFCKNSHVVWKFLPEPFKISISTFLATILLTPRILQKFWMNRNSGRKINNVHHLTLRPQNLWQFESMMWFRI